MKLFLVVYKNMKNITIFNKLVLFTIVLVKFLVLKKILTTQSFIFARLQT